MLLQSLVLFRELPSPEWLRSHHESGLFRAVAELTSGTYEGLALVSTVEPHHVALRDLQQELVARTSGRATVASTVALLPPLPVPLAHIPGDLHITFALLKLRRGAFAAYAEYVSSLGIDGSVAAGVLLGSAEHNLALEVVGSDDVDVFRTVHALLEHEAVESAELLHTTEALTLGFGDTSD